MITLLPKIRKPFNSLFKNWNRWLGTLLATVAFSTAQAKFVVTENCQQAYSCILQLRLKEASALLDNERKSNPSNSLVLLLDNYWEYFNLIASDRLEDYELMKRSVPRRLDALENEQRSPWYYYSLAEVNLQYAFMRARFQEYWGAAWSMRRASGLLDDSEKHYPNFLPAKKCRGVLLSVLGAVPTGLKVAIVPLGLRGNTREGLILLDHTLGEMKAVSLQQGPADRKLPMAGETALYLSYIQAALNERAPDYALCIKRIDENMIPSPLTAFVKTSIAIRNSQTTDALKFLNEKPPGSKFTPFYQLEYFMGVAKLNRLDTDALSCFQRFLGETKGVSFVKDSYLRIAWIYRLEGNTKSYTENINNVLMKGYASQDKDKQAICDAAEPVLYPELLRARLLFDGGFYDRAGAELKKKTPANYPELHNRLEFLYRSGRIAEACSYKMQAITAYIKTIEGGKNSPWYYAANASLHLGRIYESQKDVVHARKAYQQCLDMHETTYKNSIDNKAKSALDRLESESH